jgi:hypothetical protein
MITTFERKARKDRKEGHGTKAPLRASLALRSINAGSFAGLEPS